VVTVGIDMLEIARLERALERRPRLALRLFTEHERETCAGRARPGQHLAARFCAKEAVIKALRLQTSPWQEIEVRSDQHGVPAIRLSGALAAQDGTIAISLTHSGPMAGAVAVAGA